MALPVGVVVVCSPTPVGSRAQNPAVDKADVGSAARGRVGGFLVRQRAIVSAVEIQRGGYFTDEAQNKRGEYIPVKSVAK